jgi:carbon starvation protein
VGAGIAVDPVAGCSSARSRLSFDLRIGAQKGAEHRYIIDCSRKGGKRLFLLFVWLFSILVVRIRRLVAGFGVTALTKRGAGNGQVASTSMLFIVFAVDSVSCSRSETHAGRILRSHVLLVLSIVLAWRSRFPGHDAWLYSYSSTS